MRGGDFTLGIRYVPLNILKGILVKHRPACLLSHTVEGLCIEIPTHDTAELFSSTVYAANGT